MATKTARPVSVSAVPSRKIGQAVTATLLGMGFACLTPQRARGLAWNATDPTASAVSTNGLTDNYGELTNECVVTNTQQGVFGTGTYLGNGWVLTALHVVSGSTYGDLVPGSNIQVNVYGQIYTVDNFYGWGSSDIQLIQLAGYTSGNAANLTGVQRGQIYTGFGETGHLEQLGGFGEHGQLNSGTDVNNQTFHRGFNIAYADGGFIDVSADGNSQLVQDGYVLGYQQAGDSGSGLWMDNGPDQDLDLNDWSLIGALDTGNTPGYFGNGGQYARVSSYAGGIISTVFPHAWLTWSSNTSGGTAVDGSGTWNLTATNFTDGTNYAFNGPEQTQQVTFGSGNGTAGVVTLGATIPIDTLVFNAAGSGSYTIAGSGSDVLDLDAAAVITTNVNATISANITGGTSTQYGAEDEVTKNGAASLTLTGQTNLSSGAYFHDRAGTVVIGSGGSFITTNGYTSVGVYTGDSATLTLAGTGAYNGAGQDFNLGDLGGTGVLNVQNSAVLTVGQLYVGKGSGGATGAGGTGTVNQTGGTITASNFVSLGTLNPASVGTYNLLAGVLQTASVQGGFGQSTFNFNGGALIATGSSAGFMQGLTATTIGNSAAVINSNGFNITVAQPLSHLASAASIDGGLTKQGTGTLTLSGASSYTGPTLVTAGTLALGGAGSIAGSSGVTISGSGAQFLQLSSVPVAQAITLTTGVLDGIGSVGAVTAGNGSGGIVTNGDGAVGALTMSSLTFSGAGTDTVRIPGGFTFAAPGQIVTNALTTPASSDAVSLNVGAQGLTNGAYDLIQYGSLAGGGSSAFALGTVASRGNHQTVALNASGSYLTLVVGGYLDQWTGSVNTNWSSGATASANFRPSTGGIAFTYADGDSVLFDDTAGTGTVNLASALAPSWTAFNNSSVAYTISSSGGYGIGGTGGLTKNGTAAVTLSTVNTLTGPVIVYGGTLGAIFSANTQFGAFNDVSSITINSGGTLSTSENGLFGFTGSNERPITINPGGILTSNSSTVTAHLGSLTLAGGTLAYPGTPTGDGLTYGSYNLDGGLVTGGTSTISVISAQGVTLTQSGGTVFNVASGTTSTGMDLNVTGTIVHASGSGDTGLIKAGNGTMELSGTNTYTSSTMVNAGNLVVSSTGAITASNSILVGNNTGVGAAMYQTGGTVTNTNAGGGGFQLGSASGASGYYSLSGGTLNVAGEIDPGGSGGGVETFGQFDMTGGTVNLPNSSSSYFLPNRGLAGETSVVDIMGGTVQIAGGGTPTNNGIDGLAMNWSESGGAQTTTITIANGGKFLTPSLAVKVNNGGNGNSLNTGSFEGISGSPSNVATLNLKSGGVLQTLGFATSTNDANVTINFNGGVLKAGTAANANFLQSLGNVYVYSGGATIDNNGQAITIAQPISSPSGQGVSGVVALGGGGYVVPPQVTFSGGGGSGATGYATINASTGAVTGVVVTNPGTGYTGAPTVTLAAQGGGSGAAALSVTMATNTAGALTFQGSGGVTTLAGSSTYTGNVIVASGTVDAANDINVAGRTNGALGNPSISGRTVTIDTGASVVLTVGNVLGTGSQTAAPALSFIVNPGGLLETAAADVGVGGGGDANIFGNLTLDGGTFSVGNGADAAYQSVILLGTVTVGGTSPSTINTNATNTTANGIMLGTSGGVTFNVARTGTSATDLTVTAPLVDSNAGTSGSLIKAGVGIMQLGATDTYTGTTSVNAGSLLIASTGSITASSSILVGNTSGVGAAMYQLGGTVTNTNAALGGFQLGSTAGASGYYSLSGGTLNVAGEIDPGGSGGGAGTFGQFDMTGGTVNLPNSSGSYFLPNRGSAGEISVVNIMGGKVQIANGGTPTDNGYDGLAVNWSGSGAGQKATITIANGGQFLTPSLTAKLNFGGNSANITTLNLDNNGTLQTLGFSNAASNNANVAVNFDGGTLMAGMASNATFLQNLGAVFIYGSGGTINNNAQAITIAQPISSPTGLGVSSASGSGGSGYVVPPQVGFSGGGGSGATGYATINSSTGAVTGIVITNPGTGYTSAPSMTLTADGGGSGATVGTVTTVNNSAGTLTFQGSGITTLSGISTDTGNTSVNAGTVDLTGALASRNITVAAGASFNASGSVNDGLSTTANLTANGSALLAGSPTVSGPTALILGSISIGAAGKVAVAAASHADRTVLVTSGLTFSGSTNDWGGQLDLAGNDMIVHGGGLATITNQVEGGYAGGTFTGQGITSSTAAANTTHLTALGVIQNDNGAGTGTALYPTFDGTTVGDADVLVKYTYYGDANLSGTVDASDYSLIDNGYLNNLTGWFNGDFNYDGVINGSDYTLIDNAFNMQGASLSTELAQPTATIAAQIAAVSAVPEPAFLTSLVFVVTPLLGRRRRRPRLGLQAMKRYSAV